MVFYIELHHKGLEGFVDFYGFYRRRVGDEVFRAVCDYALYLVVLYDASCPGAYRGAVFAAVFVKPIEGLYLAVLHSEIQIGAVPVTFSAHILSHVGKGDIYRYGIVSDGHAAELHRFCLDVVIHRYGNFRGVLYPVCRKVKIGVLAVFNVVAFRHIISLAFGVEFFAVKRAVAV